ncbi:unnamed protein product, partial [Dovyalis caffra]
CSSVAFVSNGSEKCLLEWASDLRSPSLENDFSSLRAHQVPATSPYAIRFSNQNDVNFNPPYPRAKGGNHTKPIA